MGAHLSFTAEAEGEHIDDCHINPVRYGYVNRVADWPRSTFHRYVERDIYARGWANGPEGDFDAGGRA
jgi:putative transposase